MSRNVKNQVHHRSRKRKMKRGVRKSTLFIAYFLTAVGLFSGLLGLKAVTVDSIAVKGNSTVDTGEIKRLVKSQVAGSYLSLFPKKSVFLYPADGIESKAMRKFKRLRRVRVRRKGLSEVAVNVSEREPYAVWCKKEEGDAQEPNDSKEKSKEKLKEKSSSTLQQDCYFADKSGFIFSEAPRFTGDVYLKYLTDKLSDISSTSPEYPKGGRVLGEKKFKRIDNFVNTLPKLGIKPARVEHMKQQDYKITLKNGTEIIFSMSQDLSEVFYNLKSSLKSKVFNNKDVKDLDYLDLRFGRKIFYKFE